MFSAQARVPIDFPEVELELASGFMDCDVEVVRTCKDLVRERSKDRLGPNIKGLVDDCRDVGVFVHNDLPNQILVRQVLFTQVDVSF